MVPAAALALRTAPGEGYGRIWKSGPLAVTSAPVLASLRCGRPDDHVPLMTRQGIRQSFNTESYCLWP